MMLSGLERSRPSRGPHQASIQCMLKVEPIFHAMQVLMSCHCLTKNGAVVTFISTNYRRIPIIDTTPMAIFDTISEFSSHSPHSLLSSTVLAMGLRSWWRRFTNRIKTVAGSWLHMDRFMSTAYFHDGSYAVWQGRPSGSSYRQFEDLCRYD